MTSHHLLPQKSRIAVVHLMHCMPNSEKSRGKSLMHLSKSLHFNHNLCDVIFVCMDNNRSYMISCAKFMQTVLYMYIKMLDENASDCCFPRFGFAHVHVWAYTRLQRGYKQILFFIKQVTFSCWCSIYLSFLAKPVCLSVSNWVKINERKLFEGAFRSCGKGDDQKAAISFRPTWQMRNYFGAL